MTCMLVQRDRWTASGIVCWFKGIEGQHRELYVGSKG